MSAQLQTITVTSRLRLGPQRGRMRVAWALTLLSWALSSCESHEAHEEDPRAEACEHLAQGPAKALTAGVDDASAVDVSAGHTRFDLALGDVAGAKGGVAKFSVAAAGDWMVALSEDAKLAVVGPNGAVIAPESSLPGGPTCSAAKVIHTYELGVGSHLLRFGPGSSAAVNLVIEAAAHTEP